MFPWDAVPIVTRHGGAFAGAAKTQADEFAEDADNRHGNRYDEEHRELVLQERFARNQSYTSDDSAGKALPSCNEKRDEITKIVLCI